MSKHLKKRITADIKENLDTIVKLNARADMAKSFGLMEIYNNTLEGVGPYVGNIRRLERELEQC